MKKSLTRSEAIEKSVFAKFRKELWAPFITAIQKYELIQENDHIAVCISGGKDSMLLALLMKSLHAHTEVPFEVTYLVMDPGYNEENIQKIKENAKTLDIPITIFSTDIFDVAYSQEKAPCYLCARMRRGHLYNKAKELGCNKIALGHHLNDAIETTIMAMFNSSKLETMIPKVHSLNFEGMALIRPLYRIKEEAIIHWAKYNELDFIRCACRFTENLSEEVMNSGSKRQDAKNLIKELKKSNPEIEDNIFRSLHAVQLNTFPGYKYKNELHSFLEDYNKEEDD